MTTPGFRLLRRDRADIFYILDDEGQHPIDPRMAVDTLGEDARRTIVPPRRFWDSINSRTRTQSPASFENAWTHLIPVGDQGYRLTCVSFALVAAIELFALRRGKKWSLSEQFANWVFNSYETDRYADGVSLFNGVQRLASWGTCPRELCEYQDANMTADPEEAPSSEAFKAATYGISRYALIDRPLMGCAGKGCCKEEPNLDGPYISNTSYLECILASEHDIVVTMAAESMNSCGDVVTTYYQPLPDSFFCLPWPPLAGHAMVMVGYNRIGPTPYFVFRNSWGKSVAYWRFSYDYVRRYARYGVVVMGVSDRMPAYPRC
ncbi:MAG: C1 family peptidase [Dokdonella sp.]